MSSLRGGFQREEADESENDDDTVGKNARQDTLLDTGGQGDLGSGLATP